MFDSVMGVGKTPLVTESITTNPYTISNDDISQLAFITIDTVGTNVSATGTPLSLTDSFFDYITNPAITLTQPAPGTSTNTHIIANFGKSIYMRGISLYFTWTRNDVVAAVYLETSTDGANWTVEESLSLSAGAGEETFTVDDANARLLRIRVTWNVGSGGGPTVIYLRKLRVWIDSKQQFYL